MHPPNCVLMSVLLMVADGFTVRGPAAPLVAPLGSSVVLPCYVDNPLPMNDLEVEWRRTDSEALLHLYQDGESQSEVQQQDYHDRAHFFTEEIQHGNFSLRLDDLRGKDEGEYTCRVYSQQDSGETVVRIKDVERLLVSGSDESIFTYGDEDVTLNCSVDSHITYEHIKVSWKKTHEGGDILVLLYQNNKTVPEAADEQYKGRVEFFTAEFPKGNFSLRLKSVSTEDKGVYICQVFAGGASANATAELGRLGFSVLHIMMMILCTSASGSALLLCFMIYCRSPERVFLLQMFLVFSPNVLMFFSFVLWGVSEGSLFESVSCCVLYFLRPLMLLWAAPYVNDFTGNTRKFFTLYSSEAEYVFFSTFFYSVLFKSALDKSLSYTGFEGIMIIVLFVTVLIFNLFYIGWLVDEVIGKLSKRINTIFWLLARISFDVLPSLQFILLFFAFGSARGGFFIVAVLPVFLTVTNDNWDLTCGERMGCLPSVRRSVWLILMILVNAIMVYFYIIALENEKDRVGWACMIAFLQLLWALINFTGSFYQTQALHRVVPVYVFGSVVVVLLNSVTLMTELILKTVNGEGAVGDLRIIAFSSEFIFTLFLMILMVFEPWLKTCLQSCQNAAGSEEVPYSGSNQNMEESHELNRLLKTEDQEDGMKPKEETWKCVVLYGFTPKQDDQLELLGGETIEILAKPDNQWWVGKKNNQTGLFPVVYVEEIGVSSDGMKPKEQMGKCVVLYDYTPEQDDELKLVQGETIEILKKIYNEWWMGQKNNHTAGLFPVDCVEEMFVPSEGGTRRPIWSSRGLSRSADGV